LPWAWAEIVADPLGEPEVVTDVFDRGSGVQMFPIGFCATTVEIDCHNAISSGRFGPAHWEEVTVKFEMGTVAELPTADAVTGSSTEIVNAPTAPTTSLREIDSFASTSSPRSDCPQRHAAAPTPTGLLTKRSDLSDLAASPNSPRGRLPPSILGQLNTRRSSHR
jgi:hypothetical protein